MSNGATHLRLLQGFTADETLLLSAARSKKGSPKAVRWQVAESGTGQSVDTVAVLAQEGPSSGFQGLLSALQGLQGKEEETDTNDRAGVTLDSMMQLARYLSGIPGRKNVVWLSGSFPVALLRDRQFRRSFPRQPKFLLQNQARHQSSRRRANCGLPRRRPRINGRRSGRRFCRTHVPAAPPRHSKFSGARESSRPRRRFPPTCKLWPAKPTSATLSTSSPSPPAGKPSTVPTPSAKPLKRRSNKVRTTTPFPTSRRTSSTTASSGK